MAEPNRNESRKDRNALDALLDHALENDYSYDLDARLSGLLEEYDKPPEKRGPFTPRALLTTLEVLRELLSHTDDEVERDAIRTVIDVLNRFR